MNEINTPTALHGGAGRPLAALAPRPRVAGKLLYACDRPLWIRGVTYGPFRPREDGTEYPAPHVVDADLDRMAAYGFNVVRTYTVPPLWLLDAAQQRGLRVLIGLPWEQHIAFLDDPGRARDIITAARAGVRRCAGHPAVLCYAAGNEIPASIVRWHGAPAIQRFIGRLYDAVKAEDPASLVTYVNYPTTEYLDLPFLDLACFNVYLESQTRFEAYVARLQHIAGDRPLVLAELGCDTGTHGPGGYTMTAEQVRAAFAAGCAGVCVFAWTDEWHRGGYDIEEWTFGLTDRDRAPKPGMTAVCRAVATAPFPSDVRWPRISVIVCSRNGVRTIRECLKGIQRLDYPDYEAIVVDDGSIDGTGAIARSYGFKTINTGGAGLSAARNAGPDRRVSGARAGDPDARDAHGRRSGTCSRLQHGVPADRAGGDPRVRPAVPGRRRRRGRRLAHSGGRRHHRLLPHRAGLASPPEHARGLLEAASWLRPFRGAPRAEVAGEIQLGRPPDVARPGVRGRRGLAPGAHLPRHVGARAVSVGIRGPVSSAVVPSLDPRVVSGRRGAGRAGAAQRLVAAASRGHSAARAVGRRARVPCGDGRRPVAGVPADAGSRGARAAVRRHAHDPPAPSRGAALRPAAERPDTLAGAQGGGLQRAVAASLGDLERDMAVHGGVAGDDRARPPGRRRGGLSGGRLRRLGPRGPRRRARRDASPDGDRRARRRPAARAAALLAPVLGVGTPRLCRFRDAGHGRLGRHRVGPGAGARRGRGRAGGADRTRYERGDRGVPPRGHTPAGGDRARDGVAPVEIGTDGRMVADPRPVR